MTANSQLSDAEALRIALAAERKARKEMENQPPPTMSESPGVVNYKNPKLRTAKLSRKPVRQIR